MIVTVARKPCAVSPITANILNTGCGGINIDSCRLGTAADVPVVQFNRKTDYPQSYKPGVSTEAGWSRSRCGYAGDAVHWVPTGGRYPANLLILTKEIDSDLMPYIRRI